MYVFYAFFFMKNFLIDIGNSAIKTAWSSPNSLHIMNAGRFDYNKKTFRSEFEKIMKECRRDCKEEPSVAGVSLLDKSLRRTVNSLIRKVLNAETEFVCPASNLPYKLKYAETIGSDRLCSSAASVKLSGSPVVLTIDFGTATTFTIVSNGSLTGGMISPGIGTSFSALISKTTLPKAKLRFPESVFTGTTEENIRAGVLYQSLFTVERVIEEAGREFGQVVTCCTGGYSRLIFERTKLIDLRDPYLVLKGINIIISS